jgi:hypothetical protein
MTKRWWCYTAEFSKSNMLLPPLVLEDQGDHGIIEPERWGQPAEAITMVGLAKTNGS